MRRGLIWTRHGRHIPRSSQRSNLTSQVNDARLRIWFASYAAVGDEYYIDNVTITPSSALPVPPVLLSPPAGAYGQPIDLTLKWQRRAEALLLRHPGSAGQQFRCYRPDRHRSDGHDIQVVLAGVFHHLLLACEVQRSRGHRCFRHRPVFFHGGCDSFRASCASRQAHPGVGTKGDLCG